MLHQRIVLCLSLIFFFSVAQAQQSDPASSGLSSQIRFSVEKYTLANGLTVLLYQDDSVPMISYHTWFRVGSKYEEAGYTGIAHLFEHMMFKGSKRYDGKQYDHILQANGGRNNAFTTQDYTGYFIDLPSSKLELAMDMESDRMVNLQLNLPNLNSEREVVKEERRMRVDNEPMGILEEAIFASVFKISPYHWPVIGYMKDIDRINLEKAQEFYRTFYAPNNAVLVIAGDISIGSTKRLIEKYYGDLPAQPILEKKFTPEPEQMAPRSQVLTRNLQSVTISDTYKIPASGADDNYALDLISNVLAHGTSSRLYKKLVYQRQLATSVEADSYNLKDAGLFEIVVPLKPGANPDTAQGVITQELNNLRTQKLNDQELQKAKNQIMKDYVDSLKTVHGKAQSLAYHEIIYGDYTRLFTNLDKYSGVTAETIQAVAQKYLSPHQRNYVELKPNQ